jgi:pimeloyl-ACP methyl ester carboxylesterase
MEHTIRTADGRVLRVEIAGDPRGRPIVTHHGTPGSGHPYGPHVADAAERGICLIGYDRPGYGGSTAQPGRTVADCATDVSAIANALGFDRIGVWGLSGGGPHALACAALLPDLVVGVVSLASPAPYDAPGLDYFGAMGQDNVDDIQLTLTDEARAREKAVEDRRQMLARSVDDMVDTSSTMLSPVDAAANSRELAQFLHDGFHDGLAPGVEGWWDDSVAHLRPWGFEVESIAIPVQLWHGRHDRFVPFHHGEWLAARIPGVEAHLTDEDGHLTLIQRRIPEAHAWLLEHL